MTGKHETLNRRRWPRRLAIGAGIVLLMAATAAVALLVSRQDTATDTISAQAIGAVDIGDAATVGIIGTVTLEPGDTDRDCIGARLTNTTPDDDPRWWIVDGNGPLADTLTLTIKRVSNPTVVDPTRIGNLGCFGESEYAETVFTGTLEEAATLYDSYANGEPWNTPGTTTFEELWVEVGIPSGADGVAIAGETASLTMAFENQTGS